METIGLDGIPGTSLWGLKARAEENSRPDGLFKDDLAASWFERLEPYFCGNLANWYSPVLQQAIALRTHILDQTVRSHLRQTPEAVVVELGAGFSTRFNRLQPSTDWYELDLPEVIELRASLREPVAPNHWYLAHSLFSQDWLDTLSGYEPESVLLLAEGLFMYFPLARIQQLFTLLNASLPGARIAFDVMGGWNVKAAQEPGEEVSAPIYWGVQKLNQVFEQFGLTPAGDLTLTTQIRQNAQYQRRLKPITRWLLSQNWLTVRLGGTVLARLGREVI